MNIFDKIQAVSNEIGMLRCDTGVFLQLQEEVGELATELNIERGTKQRDPGPDGVVGEAIDVLITIVDFINLRCDPLDEEFQAHLDRKLTKWKGKHL